MLGASRRVTDAVLYALVVADPPRFCAHIRVEPRKKFITDGEAEVPAKQLKDVDHLMRFAAELGVILSDEVLEIKELCTVSPGFLMPGPKTCNCVHALAHVPAVVRPAEKSQ